jgi:hypothetical protein
MSKNLEGHRRTPRSAMTAWAVGLAIAGLSAGAVAVGHRAVAQAPGEALIEPAGDTAPAKVRLLTEGQYRNTIANVFGSDILVQARLAPVRRARGGLLAVGTTTAGIAAADAEAFHRVAYAVADQVVDPVHRNRLIPCRPVDEKAADPACAAKFLSRTGGLLFRRPMTEAELQSAVGTSVKAATEFKDFYKGLSYALGGMLSSPNVLFVIERTEDDPTRPGFQRLTAYSLATRMSLLLWNAAPDEALLAAAENGELHDPVMRARQVDEMVASPRFESGVRAFFSDMLMFEDFITLNKDPTIFANFTGRSVNDASEQMLKTVVHHVVDEDADYRKLFTSRTTFLTPNLAPLYGVKAPSSGWARYDLPEESIRQGLLMQIGFLSAHSHPGRTSPTRRGRALREQLLCQLVPDPPSNVDFSIIEDPNAKFTTARERLAAHSSDPACAGCHKITDPMGLALENFDGAGQFRTTENGAVIDVSGGLDGITFKDASGLAQAMHDNPATVSCLVKRVFSYGMGRDPMRGDRPLVSYFERSFARDGYRMTALMRTLATSRAFSQAGGVGGSSKVAGLGGE